MSTHNIGSEAILISTHNIGFYEDLTIIIFESTNIIKYAPYFFCCFNTSRCNAPVICIPGSLGAGDSGDIAGPKCRDLTFDASRQCRRCAGVLISRQNSNLFHILTTRGKLSLYICTV